METYPSHLYYPMSVYASSLLSSKPGYLHPHISYMICPQSPLHYHPSIPDHPHPTSSTTTNPLPHPAAAQVPAFKLPFQATALTPVFSS